VLALLRRAVKINTTSGLEEKNILDLANIGGA